MASAPFKPTSVPSTGKVTVGVRGLVVIAEDDAAPVAGDGIGIGVVVGGAADRGVVVRREVDRIARGAFGLEGTPLVLHVEVRRFAA